MCFSLFKTNTINSSTVLNVYEVYNVQAVIAVVQLTSFYLNIDYIILF